MSLQENNHLVVVDLKRAQVHLGLLGRHRGRHSGRHIEEDGRTAGRGHHLARRCARRATPRAGRRRGGSTTTRSRPPTKATTSTREASRAAAAASPCSTSTGSVEFEAGNTFEHELVRAGHSPESRSENKGSEPEGLEVGTSNGRTYLFVAAERANAVGVYDVRARRRASCRCCRRASAGGLWHLRGRAARGDGRDRRRRRGLPRSPADHALRDRIGRTGLSRTSSAPMTRLAADPMGGAVGSRW